jgi:hypothetical protein
MLDFPTCDKGAGLQEDAALQEAQGRGEPAAAVCCRTWRTSHVVVFTGISAFFVYKPHLLTRRSSHIVVFTGFSAVFVYKTHLLTHQEIRGTAETLRQKAVDAREIATRLASEVPAKKALALEKLELAQRLHSEADDAAAAPRDGFDGAAAKAAPSH